MDVVDLESEWHLLSREVIYASFEGREDPAAIKRLEKLMLEHARNLEFEKAARVRDQLSILREQAFGAGGGDNIAVI